MSSPTPSRRHSGDSSVLLSPILSPTASQTDLTGAAYPPRANRPPKGRRGSTTSSIISLNSSLGTVVDWRASKDYGGGAGGGGSASSTSISSLLETPQSRASAASRPKPGEIPPVTLTSIPKIKPSEFAPYLRISGEYEKYRRAKDMGLEEHIRLASVNQPKHQPVSPSPSVADPVVAGGESGLLQNAGGGGDTSSANSSPRRRRARKGSLAATPLSTVPAVYFDENFQLENPRTFDVVSERSDVIRPTPTNSAGGPVLSSGASVSSLNSQRKALATNAILQEKLSWYMDTVEVHLISSISTASSSFFAALGDLRELHSEATASVHKIQGLRKELVRLDEEQAVKGLEIVRLRRRRDNIARLEGAVKQTERVLQTFQSAERALVDNEVDAALAGVAETDRLICGRGQEGLLDLRPVRALEAVSADLAHLRWRIGKAFEARFVEGLLTDLRKHVERVPPAETLRRFAQSFQREQYQRFVSANQQDNLQPPPRSSSLPPEYTQLSDSLRSQLMRHLNGLQRAKHVNEAVQAYRDAVIKEAKSLIRRNMPSGDDNESAMSGMTNSRSGGIRTSSQDKSLLLARSLRSLGPADSEDLLVRIYTSVSELVRRLGTQQKMLLDVTMRMGETGVGGMLSPRLEQNGFHGATNGEQNPNGGPEPISMDISDLISSAVEIAQSQIVKIVNVRSEQVTTYSTDWFLRYFTLNRLFTQECEAVSVRVGSGLQNAVSAQIREFLNLWQRERIRMLAECLEKDKWAPREFENERQKGVHRIMEAATHDPEDWVRAGRIWELRDEENNTAPPPTTTPATAAGGGGDAAGDSTTVANGNGSEANGVKAPAPGKPHAVVDNQKFILPESGIMVLKELEGYLKLLIVIPGMATDIANNLLSFLKLHNSRTYQLILGAGATRTAGLRSITTKHLAMASQGLSIITSLLPYLRETVRRRTPQSPTLQDFDKVKRTYQQYQSEIHTKLISIMSERVKVHVLNLKAQDWDAARVGEEAGGKYYMETLCKETTVLHKVLSKHLPKETLVGIMTPVFGDYRARLEDGFRDVVVRSEGAKGRMIQDAQMFIDRLSRLDGYSGSGDAILQIAQSKVVVGRSSTPAISTSSNNSGGS